MASSSSEESSEVEATTHRVTPFNGAKLDGSEDFDDESEGSKEQEDDNFIVEDDGAGFTELPVEFSMSTHEDLAHQFKIIFQFFVHVAIQPPEDRHEFMSRQMKSGCDDISPCFFSSSQKHNNISRYPCKSFEGSFQASETLLSPLLFGAPTSKLHFLRFQSSDWMTCSSHYLSVMLAT